MEENKMPIIDVGALLTGPPEEEAKVVQQIAEALQDIGFFYISNHGISLDEQEVFLNTGRRFFNLPQEDKVKLTKHAGTGSNGYVAIAAENLQSDKLDHKEAFNVCVIEPHPLYFNNQWPAPEALPGWKEDVLDMQGKFEKLGFALCRAFSLALGQPPDFLEKAFEPIPSGVLRYLRYPPTPSDGKWIGCGSHSDYGLLTILLQDKIGGLQVKYKDEWIDATPIPGDLMELLTNGAFKATEHRVTNNSPTQDRYVSLLFFEPCLDMTVECVPKFQHREWNKPRPTSFSEHLIGKLKASYV